MIHGRQPSKSAILSILCYLDNNRVREFAVRGYLLPADGIFTGDSLADQLEALAQIC